MTTEKTKYTLLYNALQKHIVWHDENHNGNLFNTPAGTVDPSRTGWVSTGITFTSGEEQWTYWICRIVEIALAGKNRTTIAEVQNLIDYLVAFHDGENLATFETRKGVSND